MSQLEAGLSDDLRRMVIERSHDLVTVLEPDGTIVYASPSWRRMLGWEPEEVVGTSLADYCHPDDVARGLRAIGDQAAGEQIPPIVTRRLTKDGRWLYVESNASPVFDADGNVTHIMGSARNVTESHELRQRITELNALYRVADAIGGAASLDELLEEAIDALLDATGADRASVLLFDDAQVMRFRAWRGLSDAYRRATDGHSPWTPDAVDPEPVLVPDVAAAGFDEELERAVVGEGIGALAFVPLVHRGVLLGKFMLYHDEPHPWTDTEVLLARTIATHLASATVRARAQDEVRASNEQLATIMGAVEEGIVVQAPSMAIVYANEAAARFVGFSTSAEFLAASAETVLARFEILDENRQPLPLEMLPGRRALHGEATEQTVCYRILATNEERWSIVRANPVYAADGEVALSVSVFRDITAGRRAEARDRFLARASDLLNETLDYERTLAAIAEMAVPTLGGHVVIDLLEDDGTLRCVGVAHLDPGRTDFVRELRRRYPPSAPDHPVQVAVRTGKPIHLRKLQAHVDEMAQDAEHAAAIRQLANTSGIVVPLIARGRTLGTIQLGTVDPQPHFDAEDVELAVELARRASLALDNAGLYRAAQERAHAAEALEFVNDGVILVDRGGIVRLWNPAAAVALGVKQATAVGRAVRELVRDWDTLAERIEPGRPQTVPVEVHGKERWLSISATSFPGGTVYAFRDLTDERRVEQLKSDFVATVSHELRTPLAAIYGAALTLRRDDVRLEDSQRRGLLDVVASEADRLARIVNDILWASRLDSGQMGIAIESCDAAALAKQVVEALRSHAPERIELVVEAADGVPPVAADPDKLRQVLTNLVDNAVKYSPDGGRVRVAVLPHDGRVRFRVQDEGLGIPPAEQGRIFEKFFRLDPNLTRGVGGTGLGLYICRELVNRMHGRIWIASDGNRGSTFTVELPSA